MVIESKENVFGAWAYTLGVVLAVLVGLVLGLITGLNLQIAGVQSYGTYASIILVLFGIAIGLLNVGTKEVNTFLLAGVTLVIVNSFALQAVIKGFFALGPVGAVLGAIFNSLLFLFVPATIIVALKSLFSISRM
jgi:hypothetical protein